VVDGDRVQGKFPVAHACLYSAHGTFPAWVAVVSEYRLQGVLIYCKSLLHFYQELMKSGICLWKTRILALFLSS
jgi:hypothetical protein